MSGHKKSPGELRPPGAADKGLSTMRTKLLYHENICLTRGISMGESSIKSGRKKGFVVLFRSAAQDGRLSLEARGLFALMVSLPEDWEYTVSGLAVKAGCGREKVRRLLKELQSVGYLIREQSHDSGGKFGGNVYVLQDEAPLPENPSNGEAENAPLPENTVNGENRQRETPSAGFPPQQNKDLTEEETKKPPKAPQGGKRPSKYDLTEDAKPVLQAYVGEDGELHRALADLIEIRVAKKAINSKRAIVSLLRELDRLSEGRRVDKLLLIRQSVSNSWKSVFPLRQSGGQRAEPSPPTLVAREEVPTW